MSLKIRRLLVLSCICYFFVVRKSGFFKACSTVYKMNKFNANKAVRDQLNKDHLLKLLEDVKTCSEDFVQANVEILIQFKSILEAKLQNVPTIQPYSKSHETFELHHANGPVIGLEVPLPNKLYGCQNSLENVAGKDAVEIKYGDDVLACSRHRCAANWRQTILRERLLMKLRRQQRNAEYLIRNRDAEGTIIPLIPTIEEVSGPVKHAANNPIDLSKGNSSDAS